jgi:hypothetical protein
MDAVALPPDPESVAEPSELSPSVNETDPVGGLVPLAASTVAVSTVDPPAEIVAGLAVSVVVVEVTGTPPHAAIRLYASTEPRPVTRS